MVCSSSLRYQKTSLAAAQTGCRVPQCMCHCAHACMHACMRPPSALQVHAHRSQAEARRHFGSPQLHNVRIVDQREVNCSLHTQRTLNSEQTLGSGDGAHPVPAKLPPLAALVCSKAAGPCSSDPSLLRSDGFIRRPAAHHGVQGTQAEGEQAQHCKLACPHGCSG